MYEIVSSRKSCIPEKNYIIKGKHNVKSIVSKPEPFANKLLITEGKKDCVSLFSGILGLEMGLNKAGFATKIAIDIDETARETVCLNFPDLDYIVKDVSEVTSSFILGRAGIERGELDLLSGGPPCQPFSKSGLRKGLDDSKGLLFECYRELLEGLQPRAFVLENVRGITSTRKGRDFRRILEEFRKTGYTLYWKILDAANYGVPQFRQRLFIIGFRKSIKFSFPEQTNGSPDEVGSKLKPYVTVQDAIRNLRNVKDYPPYRGKYAHLLKDIPEGLNYSYYCKERGHPNPLFKWRSKFWNFLLKIERKRPSLTIHANPGNNTGPFHWENRKLSICELKRLQTIPDWFEMKGSYLTKHRHIGNAVPPLLAFHVGAKISEALDEECQIDKSKYQKLITEESRLYGINSGHRSGKGKLCITNGKKVALFPKRAIMTHEKALC